MEIYLSQIMKIIELKNLFSWPISSVRIERNSSSKTYFIWLDEIVLRIEIEEGKCITSHVSYLGCNPPRITLIPDTSILLNPLQFRRNKDFFISLNIELNCNQSLSIIWRWTINNGTVPMAISWSILTSWSEVYIPSRTLSYGIDQLNLIVSMTALASLTSTVSGYIEIPISGITVNLVPLGTLMINSGHEQDLLLNPG